MQHDPPAQHVEGGADREGRRQVEEAPDAVWHEVGRRQADRDPAENEGEAGQRHAQRAPEGAEEADGENAGIAEDLVEERPERAVDRRGKGIAPEDPGQIVLQEGEAEVARQVGERGGIGQIGPERQDRRQRAEQPHGQDERHREAREEPQHPRPRPGADPGLALEAPGDEKARDREEDEDRDGAERIAEEVAQGLPGAGPPADGPGMGDEDRRGRNHADQVEVVVPPLADIAKTHPAALFLFRDDPCQIQAGEATGFGRSPAARHPGNVPHAEHSRGAHMQAKETRTGGGARARPAARDQSERYSSARPASCTLWVKLPWSMLSVRTSVSALALTETLLPEKSASSLMSAIESIFT